MGIYQKIGAGKLNNLYLLPFYSHTILVLLTILFLFYKDAQSHSYAKWCTIKKYIWCIALLLTKWYHLCIQITDWLDKKLNVVMLLANEWARELFNFSYKTLSQQQTSRQQRIIKTTTYTWKLFLCTWNWFSRNSSSSFLHIMMRWLWLLAML